MYDLIVLGGGIAGANAATYASNSGLSVALIEQNQIGGTCLNCGCIPSKIFLNASKLIHNANSFSKLGLTPITPQIDMQSLIERKNRTVKRLSMGLVAGLGKVDVVKGYATVVDSNQTEQDGIAVKVEDRVIHGRRLVLATGSVNVIPPIKGITDALADGFVLTNQNIFDLQTVPKRLAIIGAGVIGQEMASFYSFVGSNVTVFERTSSFGAISAEAGKVVLKTLNRNGVSVLFDCSVQSVHNGELQYVTSDGVVSSAQFDKVLLCAGRRPNSDGLTTQLQGLSLDATTKGVCTDKYLRTNIRNVFAIGDLNGKSMLAHTGIREGEVVVNNIIAPDSDSMDYASVPSVIFSFPEIASVGLIPNDDDAGKLNYRISVAPMTYSGRFLAENASIDGYVKLVSDNSSTPSLIGAEIVGSYATELIFWLELAINQRIPLSVLKKQIFAHPTVNEAVKAALFAL